VLATPHAIVYIPWTRLFMVGTWDRSSISKKFIQWPIKFAGASIGESISSTTFDGQGHADQFVCINQKLADNFMILCIFSSFRCLRSRSQE